MEVSLLEQKKCAYCHKSVGYSNTKDRYVCLECGSIVAEYVSGLEYLSTLELKSQQIKEEF